VHLICKIGGPCSGIEVWRTKVADYVSEHRSSSTFTALNTSQVRGVPSGTPKCEAYNDICAVMSSDAWDDEPVGQVNNTSLTFHEILVLAIGYCDRASF